MITSHLPVENDSKTKKLNNIGHKYDVLVQNNYKNVFIGYMRLYFEYTEQIN